MASDDVQRLAVLVEANTKSYENAMMRLEKKTNAAMAKATKAVTGLDARMASLGRGAATLAGTLGVAIGARALGGFIVSSVRAGEAIGDAADKIGISAEAWQEWGFVAGQAGTDIEVVANGFKFMAKSIGDAQNGNKQAIANFRALGISVDELSKMTPDQAFERILDAISRIQDPIQRTNALLDIFGRSGSELSQVAQLGARGIDELRRKARDLGLVLSNETIKKSQDMGDKLDIMASAFRVAGINLAEKFMPAMTSFYNLVTSQGFQDGVGKLATGLGKILDFLTAHPELIGALGGAFIGGKLTKSPWGAAAGAAIGGFATGNFGAEPTDEWSAFGMGDAVKKSGGLELTVTKPGSISYAPGNGGPSEIDKTTKAYKEQVEELRNQINALNLSAREQFIWNELQKLGAGATSEMATEVRDLAGNLYDMQEAQAKAKELMDSLRSAASAFLSDFVHGMMEGKSATESLISALQSLANKFLDIALTNLGNALFDSGGILSSLFGGAKAAGGAVSGGKAYLVGEKGPELFVPGASGAIVPNSAMGRGGAPIIQIINNTSEPVRQEQSRSGDGRTLTRIVVGEVKTNMAQGGFNGVLGGRFGARSNVARTN